MFPVQPQPHGINSQDGSNSSQVVTQDHVQVPWIDFQPCRLLCLLLSAINTLQESDCDIYARVINVVGQHPQSCIVPPGMPCHLHHVYKWIHYFFSVIANVIKFCVY